MDFPLIYVIRILVGHLVKIFPCKFFIYYFFVNRKISSLYLVRILNLKSFSAQGRHEAPIFNERPETNKWVNKGRILIARFQKESHIFSQKGSEKQCLSQLNFVQFGSHKEIRIFIRITHICLKTKVLKIPLRLSLVVRIVIYEKRFPLHESSRIPCSTYQNRILVLALYSQW